MNRVSSFTPVNGHVRIVNEAPDVKAALDAERISFAGRDIAELKGLETEVVEWLVTDVFGCDQPTLFGARSKAGKTTQLCDLSVALASQTPWLGYFEVPKPRRVLFITGESNYRATAKRLYRACKARGLEFDDLMGMLRIEAIEFPKLPNLYHLEAIQHDVEEHDIDVVIIDPLFRGMTGLDTNRMAEIGEAIVGFARACQPANLIISHHTTKAGAREYGKPPELEDMTGAGIAESCGNWWLMGRNEAYQWDWMHDLCVQYGGRDEQAGAKRILFNEQEWTFEVEGFRDFKESQAEVVEQAKSDAKRDAEEKKNLEARAKILASVRNVKTPNSKNQILELAGIPRKPFGFAFGELIREGKLVIRPYVDALGRSQSVGYLLSDYAKEYDQRHPPN